MSSNSNTSGTGIAKWLCGVPRPSLLPSWQHLYYVAKHFRNKQILGLRRTKPVRLQWTYDTQLSAHASKENRALTICIEKMSVAAFTERHQEHILHCRRNVFGTSHAWYLRRGTEQEVTPRVNRYILESPFLWGALPENAMTVEWAMSLHAFYCSSLYGWDTT